MVDDARAAVKSTKRGFRYTIPWVEGVRRTVAWLDAHGRVDNSDDNLFDDQVIAAWERARATMSSTWPGSTPESVPVRRSLPALLGHTSVATTVG